jgi:methyl-accepting chemotaxis protein
MNRRLAGRAMIAIAAMGFVTAILGTIVAYQLIGQLGTNIDRSLRIGEETLVTLDDTIDAADEVVTSVQSGLVTIEDTLTTLNESIADTTSLASTTSELASALPANLERIDDALATLEEIGGTIDGVLSGLSDIPFGPDYDPAVQLDEAVAGVRAGLEPLAGDLESIAGELDDLTSGSDDLRGQLDDLTTDVTATREALDGSAVLLDQYRASAAEALELAQASREDLDTDRTQSQVMVIVLGLAIALGQAVPAWIGRELLVAERARLATATNAITTSDMDTAPSTRAISTTSE